MKLGPPNQWAFTHKFSAYSSSNHAQSAKTKPKAYRFYEPNTKCFGVEAKLKGSKSHAQSVKGLSESLRLKEPLHKVQGEAKQHAWGSEKLCTKVHKSRKPVEWLGQKENWCPDFYIFSVKYAL